VFEGQAAPSGGSVDLVTEALTGLGRLHRELEDDGVPFALPVGYVPMLYDPSAVTPDRNTNLGFLLDYAAGALAVAVTAEEEAQGATREYDTNLDALTGELDLIQNARDERLVQLCGSAAEDPARPDLDRCRTNPGGLFAQAAGELEEAGLGVKSALTSVDVQDRRVALHREMMIHIHGIREETIRFVDATDQEIGQKRQHRGWFDAIQSIATFALGAYSGKPDIALQGAMGFGDAVIGGSIDQQIAELEAAKALRLLQSESDVEYVRLMTELAELEVQFLQLGVEVLLSVRRRMNAELRVAQIESELRAVRAQAALQTEQSLGQLANDPMFRVIRNRRVTRATFFKEDARRAAYLAALALDYELNLTFAHRDRITTSLSAGAGGLEDVLSCMSTWSSEFRLAYGGGQSFSDEISLREDVFGIRGPITDAVTGQTLSEAEQFRQMLLQPTHLGTAEVAVGMTFPTSIGRANPIFSPDVCNDQIESVQVKLIGDGLGDDQATVHVEQGGATFLRGCESYREGRGDVVREYHVIPDTAIIYAGVNGYPATAPDSQLYGRAVAATDWTLALPRGQRNADVDFTRIEDIVVRVTHRAHSLSTGLRFAPACGL
jgi:hypothetical protein